MTNNNISNYNINKVSIFRKLWQWGRRLKVLVKLLLLLILMSWWFSYPHSWWQEVTNKIQTYSANKFDLILNQVIIEGSNNFYSEGWLQEQNLIKGQPILSFDCWQLKSALEQESWIEEALVEIRLPHTIYVGFKEKTPVAIWQNAGRLSLIDNKGSVITSSQLNEFSHLIQLIGNDANIYAPSLLAALNTHPDLSVKVTYGIRYGERRWNLVFNDGLLAKMPEHNFQSAWDELYRLYEQGSLSAKKYKSIDLRLSHKRFIEK